MKAEDLIDHNSSLHLVLDNSRTAVCSSNDDTFDQEFPPIDCKFEGLFSWVSSLLFSHCSLVCHNILVFCWLVAALLIKLFWFINVIALFLLVRSDVY